MARFRFRLYQNIVALFTLLSFRSQKVETLAPPTPGKVEYRPFTQAYPATPIDGLYDPSSFGAGDAARLKRIALSKKMLGLVARIAPATTPAVPRQPDELIAAVYPRPFRKAWPAPPILPPHLDDKAGEVDVLAELAVRGPFASALRAVGDGTYVIDLDWMLAYDPRDDLIRPGGRAVFAVEGDHLRTVALFRGDEEIPLRAWRGSQPERDALLAAMNEDLTTFRHNVATHLATLTPFALATTNELGVDHPIRRALHHCFHTVLIGNRELAELQLGGPAGFSATIFSHDHATVAAMATDVVARYDIWDFEPDTQFARRATTETSFAYPYRDNVLELWTPTLTYLRDYVRLYYADDDAVRADTELAAWLAALEELLPNGVKVPEGGATVEWLARLCATVIHVSTVEHDLLNNVTWDYSTIGSVVPTVVPRSGQRMDQRRAFDLVATIIGTWKPYNMLLTADIPSLALDERGRQVMAAWIEELRRIQREMDQRGADPSLSYPAKLNVSISN